MSRQIKNLRDVVEWGLCVGCGACASACPQGGVRLRDLPGEGIRPYFDETVCRACPDPRECLGCCPGWQVDADLLGGNRRRATRCEREFGPALEIWEGHASDPEIRFEGSSGALLTALALYCLEREGMEFALHTGAQPDKPWLNQTVQSRGRAELLARAGSRYAPASPCDGLGLIEQSPRPCVFIGKPCDTAAAAQRAAQRPALREKLGLIMAFFCAGTPSTRGTLNLLDSLEVGPDEVQTLRYRGEGWPGRFKVTRKEGGGDRSLSYEDSWDRLNRHRPFRCHLCPDGLGRVADLACGDAWNRHAGDDNPGCSIVLVRTAKGQEILRRALSAGYVTLRPLAPEEVLGAQRNLLERRRQLFGRLLAMRLLGVPAPRFKGFSLARSWLGQPPPVMARTVLGTWRRILARGLRKRRPQDDMRNAECGMENKQA